MTGIMAGGASCPQCDGLHDSYSCAEHARTQRARASKLETALWAIVDVIEAEEDEPGYDAMECLVASVNAIARTVLAAVGGSRSLSSSTPDRSGKNGS